MSGTSGGQNNNPEFQDAISRRRFLRKAGGVTFGVTILDILHMTPNVHAADCGNGNSDSFCGSLSADENCGGQAGGQYDEDGVCGALLNSAPDAKCGPIAGTSNYDADQECEKASDPDGSCRMNTVTGPDGSGGSKDVDQYCGTSSGAGKVADQCCGDCDDNHDSDQTCNSATPSGSVDSDELCGHASRYNTVFNSNEDQVCSNRAAADQGCGIHSAGYESGGSWNDPDQNCNRNGATDQNCSSQAADSNCNASAPAATTSPDEKCSATDNDGACRHYDKDESCSASSTDEACGYNYAWTTGNHVDPDSSCGNGNADEACGKSYNVPTSGTDTDSNA